jgi:hypothetical protein
VLTPELFCGLFNLGGVTPTLIHHLPGNISTISADCDQKLDFRWRKKCVSEHNNALEQVSLDGVCTEGASLCGFEA